MEVLPIDRAVIKVLRETPSVWTDISDAEVPAIEESARSALVKAGMLEARRETLVTADGVEEAVVVTSVESGEFTEDQWKRAVVVPALPQNWLNGTRLAHAIQMNAELKAIRRTSEGEQAIADLAAGDGYMAIQFVGRKGFFRERARVKPRLSTIDRRVSLATARSKPAGESKSQSNGGDSSLLTERVVFDGETIERTITQILAEHNKVSPDMKLTMRPLVIALKARTGRGSNGIVSKSPAWAAYEKVWKDRNPPVPKAVPLADNLGCEDDALKILIKQQGEDDFADRGRAKRRPKV